MRIDYETSVARGSRAMPELSEWLGMNADYPTFRVESSYRGDSCIEDDLLLSHIALELARDVWKHKQPLDWVRVINERTGATRDEIHHG